MTGEEGDAWMGPVGEQMVPLNCPPGLEYLTMIDQLIVKQKLEMLEAVAGVMGYGLETSNKYKIKNVLGQVRLSHRIFAHSLSKNLYFRIFIKPRKTRTAAPEWCAAPPGHSTWSSGTTWTGGLISCVGSYCIDCVKGGDPSQQTSPL